MGRVPVHSAHWYQSHLSLAASRARSAPQALPPFNFSTTLLPGRRSTIRILLRCHQFMRRTVSKSHRLQCRKQLHLLIAGRVPICLVATLVSLATAARSLCHYSTQEACWLRSGVQHDSRLQQHDCVRWCHHLCLVRSCRLLIVLRLPGSCQPLESDI